MALTPTPACPTPLNKTLLVPALGIPPIHRMKVRVCSSLTRSPSTSLSSSRKQDDRRLCLHSRVCLCLSLGLSDSSWEERLRRTCSRGVVTNHRCPLLLLLLIGLKKRRYSRPSMWLWANRRHGHLSATGGLWHVHPDRRLWSCSRTWRSPNFLSPPVPVPLSVPSPFLPHPSDLSPQVFHCLKHTSELFPPISDIPL